MYFSENNWDEPASWENLAVILSDCYELDYISIQQQQQERKIKFEVEHRGDEHRINDKQGKVRIICMATDEVLYELGTTRTEPIDVAQEGFTVQ